MTPEKIQSIIEEHVRVNNDYLPDIVGADAAARAIHAALQAERERAKNLITCMWCNSELDTTGMDFERQKAITAEHYKTCAAHPLAQEVRRLQAVMWDAQLDLAEDAGNAHKVCEDLNTALGHKFSCRWTVSQSFACTCGGVAAPSDVVVNAVAERARKPITNAELEAALNVRWGELGHMEYRRETQQFSVGHWRLGKYIEIGAGESIDAALANADANIAAQEAAQ